MNSFKRQTAWKVYIPVSCEEVDFSGGRLLKRTVLEMRHHDTVYFDPNMTRREVYDSLVNHDCFPTSILLEKED